MVDLDQIQIVTRLGYFERLVQPGPTSRRLLFSVARHSSRYLRTALILLWNEARNWVLGDLQVFVLDSRCNNWRGVYPGKQYFGCAKQEADELWSTVAFQFNKLVAFYSQMYFYRILESYVYTRKPGLDRSGGSQPFGSPAKWRISGAKTSRVYLFLFAIARYIVSLRGHNDDISTLRKHL